jgi:hypothetical protein
MKPMKQKPEFVYRDPRTGKLTDEGLHEPILAGEHEPAVEISRRRAREREWTSFIGRSQCGQSEVWGWVMANM